MSDPDGLVAFLDKWRGRWPEWRVAEVFLGAGERETAMAWLALQQELAEAAWGGSDPRPGEAKLGWWSEELQGWSQGRRRHPLGALLQRRSAPWLPLARALPTLLASREPAVDLDDALRTLAPYAEALAAVDAALAPEGAVATEAEAAIVLLGQRAQVGQGVGVPLQLRAVAGADASPQALSVAWAKALLATWPDPAPGARAQRMHAALLRERLRRQVDGRPPDARLPWMRALHCSWRAARG